MKKHATFVLATIVVIAFSQMAWAKFSIEELQTATKAACEEFKKDRPDHVKHFTGYKSWLSGEESKVKIYVTHDGMNMDFTYLCHKHDDAIECHKQ